MQDRLWKGKTLEECKACKHHKGVFGKTSVICNKAITLSGVKHVMPRSKDGVLSVDC